MSSKTSYSLSTSKGIPIDTILDTLFQKKENGFFIELGANDGLTQSNTAFFELNRNWKGILIEPSPAAFELCKKNRPNSTCFNYACVSNTFTEQYIYGDFTGCLMSSVNGERKNKPATIKVPVRTLESILDEIKPSEIDILSLDTEGYELNILEGLNLKKYRPQYLLIEVYTKDYTMLVNYLESYNYTLIDNISNYNYNDNPYWDGTHNDYLFVDSTHTTL